MKNIITVLFVLPSAGCGGAEKVLITLLRHLPRDQFQPYLILIDAEGPLLKSIPEDVRIISLGQKKVRRALWPLFMTIRSIHPDIIVSSIYHLNIAILLLKTFLARKIKFFIRESNLPSISLKVGRFPVLFGILIRSLYPLSDKIICLGKEMKTDLMESFHVSENKICVIPNPVDISFIKKQAVKIKNPLANDKINFVAAGTFAPQKGFDLLIEAMELISSESPNVHLTILGDGNLRKRFTQLVNSKGLSSAITIAGFKENPYPYFYHADRFVLSSRYEGLPNVVLESLALGTPAIAFDNPGCIREIITQPDAGTIVNPCTSEALAKAMTQSFDSVKKRHKQSILPKKFEINSVMQCYQQLFFSK